MDVRLREPEAQGTRVQAPVVTPDDGLLESPRAPVRVRQQARLAAAVDARLSRHRLQRILQVALFSGAAAAVVVAALPHGSYDIVRRQGTGVFVWATVMAGLAAGVLPRRRPGTAALLALGALLTVSAWTALGLVWTESAERTAAESVRVLSYAGVLALALCMLSRSTWRAAASGLACGAALVCALALTSRLWPGLLPVDDFGGLFDSRRLNYPLGYWNALGAWAAMATVMALAWSAHARASATRAIALAAVPLCAATTYLTYSRGAAAALLVGVVVVIALAGNRVTTAAHAAVGAAASALLIVAARHAPAVALGSGDDGTGGVVWALFVASTACALAAIALRHVGIDGVAASRRLTAGILTTASVTAVAAAVVVGPQLSEQAWRAFNSGRVAEGADPSARLLSLGGARDKMWEAAFDAFEAKPLTGTGAGTFEFWWSRNPGDTQFLRDAHSLWLEALGEQGLPGAALLAVFLVCALTAAALARRRLADAPGLGANAGCIAAVIAFVLAASVDWLWESTALTLLAIALVGAAAAPLARSRIHLPATRRLALAVAALAAGAVGLPGILATEKVRQSEKAVTAGTLSEAVELAGDGIAAQPWASTPYVQRALALEVSGALDAAVADIRRAIDREPTNWRPWMLLARLEAERDRPLAAVAAYRRGRRLRPLAALVLLAPPLDERIRNGVTPARASREG